MYLDLDIKITYILIKIRLKYSLGGVSDSRKPAGTVLWYEYEYEFIQMYECGFFEGADTWIFFLKERTVERRKTESEAVAGTPASQDEGEWDLS